MTADKVLLVPEFDRVLSKNLPTSHNPPATACLKGGVEVFEPRFINSGRCWVKNESGTWICFDGGVKYCNVFAFFFFN